MINRCRNCDQILKEGDAVRVTVESIYHALRSKVSFSISQDIREADAATLEHKDCLKGERE